MADDEEATIRAINAYREVMTDLIRGHNGNVVDAKGDNVLAEFSSVVDAVRCAVDIQRQLALRNAELPEGRKMEFRIGVNLGDVIEEDSTIYGDGVNMAARIEGLAEPGGVSISGTAFDQVREKLELGYEYLGEQSVKNIPRPIRVYKVLLAPEYAGKVIGEATRKPKQWRWTAVAIVLIVVAGMWAIWNFYPRPPPIEPASVEKMAYPLPPDKPSIAVLPFDNLSGESDQDYFADGIAEDIITRLSLIHNLFVIARNSSFSYKGRKVKVQQVAEDLGVRYLLEGSVRKSGDQVRITAQLIDALTGKHLWADRYDRELKDVFVLQDEITRKVVTELAVKLTEGENARLMQRGTNNWEAWTHYLKGVEQFRRFKKDANLKARELSEKAIALDANYSQAYSLLSWTYAWPFRFGLSSAPAQDFKKAEELANKASDLDSSNHDAQNVLGFIYMVRGQYDQAITQGKRAVELTPNVTDTYALLALSQNFAGYQNEAIDSIIKAMRLAPFYPPWYLRVLARSYFMAGRFEDALETFNRSLHKDPDWFRSHVWIAAAYTALGKPERAKAEAEKVLDKQPTFSLEEFNKAFPYRNRAEFDRILAYAREAGLPDNPPLPLPDKPSIAVLPFENMSGDPKQEYLSDGITESIIMAVSKIHDLFVIARNSTFTYKGKAVKVQQVARELA
jgi:adenylate cyclase